MNEPKTSPTLRAAIYARVSSKQQTDAQTIGSQLEALKSRVQADGLQLDAELCFIDEGYSGGTLLRPALERLRDQAAAGALDRLYVHSPDRLARHYPYQVLLVEELQRHGVDLVFLNHDIGRTPEENLLLQVQGMMAEYERAKILERSRRGKRHAARRGAVNVLSGAPYGYRYIGKYAGGGHAHYEIDEAEAAVVRQIFAWIALKRFSIGEVCRRLKKQGIPSPRGKSYWDRTTIWGILHNPAYVGQAHFGKTRIGPTRPRLRPQRGKLAQPRRAQSIYDTPINEQIVIPVPAIVEGAVFDAVREQLAENRKRSRQRQRGERYLMQGLLVCGRCGYAFYGKPLSRSARKGRPRDYAYYRCIGTDAYRFGGQALALMDHPNIARVLDAGATDSGRPYFVMELVRGIPIAEYCDQNQLSPRDRLDLFVTVCQAVQHAHQKGIIHRDIKPSNVLVTSHDGKPVAKVIDFGVAKAISQQLTDRSIYTNFAQMIGTPLYMSPEQAEMSGLDIDTRSDIYSLGVLLYELLTGTTPIDKKRFAKAAYDEIRRLTHHDPVRPGKPAQLRSGTPAGVVQELYALSFGHFVTQALRIEAARTEDIDPDRLSFIGTLRILRCRLPECAGAASFTAWYRRLLWEIGRERLEPRRQRINPRVVKHQVSNYAKKLPHHRPNPPLRKSFLETVVMLI